MIIKHLACDACEQFSPEHENDERKQNALSSSGSSRVSMSIAWAYQHQPHFLNVTYMTDELKTLSHSIAMCVCMVWKPSDPSSTTTKIAISQQTFETTTKTKYERLTVQLTHNPTKVEAWGSISGCCPFVCFILSHLVVIGTILASSHSRMNTNFIADQRIHIFSATFALSSFFDHRILSFFLRAAVYMQELCACVCVCISCCNDMSPFVFVRWIAEKKKTNKQQQRNMPLLSPQATSFDVIGKKRVSVATIHGRWDTNDMCMWTWYMPTYAIRSDHRQWQTHKNVLMAKWHSRFKTKQKK